MCLGVEGAQLLELALQSRGAFGRAADGEEVIGRTGAADEAEVTRAIAEEAL
jgi:hypothetical protein